MKAVIARRRAVRWRRREGVGLLAMPYGALALCLLAYAAPFAAGLMEMPRGSAAALWLMAIVPVFVAAYHGGPRGAVLAAGIAVGAVVLSEAVATAIGRPEGDRSLLAGVAGTLLGVAAGVAWITRQLRRDRDRAEQLALTDVLTGMPNRRYALAVLDQEFAAAQRGRPLAIALIDLDEFKRYNDLHGHAAGDDALRRFASVLGHTTRQMNLSARFGGEEFIAVLSDTDPDGALIFLERVRRALASGDSALPSFTFSAGVAAYAADMRDPEALIAAADTALYRAKAMGRDRAELHRSEPALAAG